MSDKRFAAPSLRKLCTAVSLVGSSPPIFVVALAAALFVPLDRCQLLLFWRHALRRSLFLDILSVVEVPLFATRRD